MISFNSTTTPFIDEELVRNAREMIGTVIQQQELTSQWDNLVEVGNLDRLSSQAQRRAALNHACTLIGISANEVYHTHPVIIEMADVMQGKPTPLMKKAEKIQGVWRLFCALFALSCAVWNFYEGKQFWGWLWMLGAAFFGWTAYAIFKRQSRMAAYIVNDFIRS